MLPTFRTKLFIKTFLKEMANLLPFCTFSTLKALKLLHLSELGCDLCFEAYDGRPKLENIYADATKKVLKDREPADLRHRECSLELF